MTLSALVTALAQVFILAIIIRSLLSWFPPSRTLAPVSAALNQATDPILRPIQQRLPMFGGFDLSPIVAIFLVVIAETVLLSLLGGH